MSRESPEIAAAFEEADRGIAIRRIRIGCIIAMILLPLGSLVDVQNYPNQTLDFLRYRLVGSLAMLPLLGFVHLPVGARHHRSVGVALAMIPASCMAWIIAHTPDAASSPYYAGLNLVLLAVGLVLQWNTLQSVAAVLGVMFVYVLAGAPKVHSDTWDAFLNNFYFIFLTGVIVVIGNSIQTRLRRSDFSSRFEVERSRIELAKANRKLGDINHQLGVSNEKLEHTNRRLRELDELKGRFFANISHELRTPLTLLIGPLETIRSEHTLQNDPRLVDLLDTMHANGMRLLKLINDLLDLVRLDAGGLQLHRTSIDVSVFVPGILRSIRSLAEGKGIHLAHHVAPDVPPVSADPDKLEKVFLNLLFNAVKFTPAGGKVEVRAFRDADQVTFQVSDSGVGIPKEQIPNVFDRFWQGDTSAQRRYQGAGIGLALVKELVEAHQGSVSVESRPGTGTTMNVRFPIADTPPTAQSPTAQPRPPQRPVIPAPAVEPGPAPEPHPESDTAAWLADLYRRAELFAGIPSLRDTVRPLPAQGLSRKPKLLIAEDEPDMLGFLRLSLQDDYELVEATDGEQAVTLARQFLPDVILCDMMMPEKDGLEVCREVRRRRSTRAIPFLMLTARADDETKLTALDAGASDYLSKPFSTAELRLRIKNLVDAYRLQKSLDWQNQKLKATLDQLQETETQLVQAEKLASLGRLSAGIIHEINNPLNFANTGLHMIAVHGRQLPESNRAEFLETLKDIQDGLGRVATIVGDLRSFTHPGAAEDDVDVQATVTSAARFLAAELRDDIRLNVSIPDGFIVRANRNKLIQVFVNLLQNAADALHQKSFPNGVSPEIFITAAVTSSHHLIRVRDNGSGIPSAVIGKVFDPFFTTKDVGSGTGLGLSICHRIVADAGGRITVQSEPGRQTEFTLEFPVPDPNSA
jgi:signal transduction histidine kinase